MHLATKFDMPSNNSRRSASDRPLLAREESQFIGANARPIPPPKPAGLEPPRNRQSDNQNKQPDALQRALAHMEASRQRGGRPFELAQMSAIQLKEEKDALKRELKMFDIEFQKQHGRPVSVESLVFVCCQLMTQPSKENKEALRVLYQRYRDIKVLTERPSQPPPQKQLQPDSAGQWSPSYTPARPSAPAFEDKPSTKFSQSAPLDKRRDVGEAGLASSFAAMKPASTRSLSVAEDSGSPPPKSRSPTVTGPLASDNRYKALKAEKRELQIFLHEYQTTFIQRNGHKVQTARDRQPVATEYQRYQVNL